LKIHSTNLYPISRHSTSLKPLDRRWKELLRRRSRVPQFTRQPVPVHSESLDLYATDTPIFLLHHKSLPLTRPRIAISHQRVTRLYSTRAPRYTRPFHFAVRHHFVLATLDLLCASRIEFPASFTVEVSETTRLQPQDSTVDLWFCPYQFWLTKEVLDLKFSLDLLQ